MTSDPDQSSAQVPVYASTIVHSRSEAWCMCFAVGSGCHALIPADIAVCVVGGMGEQALAERMHRGRAAESQREARLSYPVAAARRRNRQRAPPARPPGFASASNPLNCEVLRYEATHVEHSPRQSSMLHDASQRSGHPDVARKMVVIWAYRNKHSPTATMYGPHISGRRPGSPLEFIYVDTLLEKHSADSHSSRVHILQYEVTAMDQSHGRRHVGLVGNDSATEDAARAYNQAADDYLAYADGDPKHLFSFEGHHAYADHQVWSVLDTKLRATAWPPEQPRSAFSMLARSGTWLRRLVTHARQLRILQHHGARLRCRPGANSCCAAYGT